MSGPPESPEDVSVRLLAVRAAWNVRNWQQKGGRTLDEVLDVISIIYRAYQRQLQRQGYLQRTYQRQLRHERNLRRMYQGQLRNERSRRRVYQIRLRHERSRRRECEEQWQRQRIYYQQQIGAAAKAQGNALYGAKVARLLNLAVCSASDGEATAALAKARALHRLAA
jgi:hypothetical protein